MNIVEVALGKRSYDILIGTGLLNTAGQWLSKRGIRGSGIIVSDETVHALYARPVHTALKEAGLKIGEFVLPPGEEHKNLEQVHHIYDTMLRLNLDRGSFALALGGGVVGDITGFAAATYMRGIDFIQIPTTLLAQVDASVGGKVAVNLPEGKNLIGAFHQPRGVLIDPAVLKTLTKRRLNAGFAEVIKHAVIHDARYFSYLMDNVEAAHALDMHCLENIIHRSCEIKAAVVSKDEKEKDLRMILNFGHTIGHAIETITDYRTYLHGEAVAIGMACAAFISTEMGILPAEHYHRIVKIIEKYALPVTVRGVQPDAVIKILHHDKKARHGKVYFVLPRRIGKVFVTDELDEKIVRAAIVKHSVQSKREDTA
jgi:3-dehydroquinate synthase